MQIQTLKQKFPALKAFYNGTGVRNSGTDDHIVDPISGTKNTGNGDITQTATGLVTFPVAVALTAGQGSPIQIAGGTKKLVTLVTFENENRIVVTSRGFDLGDLATNSMSLYLLRSLATDVFMSFNATDFYTFSIALPVGSNDAVVYRHATLVVFDPVTASIRACRAYTRSTGSSNDVSAVVTAAGVASGAATPTMFQAARTLSGLITTPIAIGAFNSAALFETSTTLTDAQMQDICRAYCPASGTAAYLNDLIEELAVMAA